MNKIKVLAVVAMLGTVLIAGARAQDSEQPSKPAPQKFELKLIVIEDSQPRECLRVIQLCGDDSFPYNGYKSLAAPGLRFWVKRIIPDNSTIDYSPGCSPSGGGPDIKEIKDFQAFCKAEGVTFVLHMAG